MVETKKFCIIPQKSAFSARTAARDLPRLWKGVDKRPVSRAFSRNPLRADGLDIPYGFGENIQELRDKTAVKCGTIHNKYRFSTTSPPLRRLLLRNYISISYKESIRCAFPSFFRAGVCGAYNAGRLRRGLDRRVCMCDSGDCGGVFRLERKCRNFSGTCKTVHKVFGIVCKAAPRRFRPAIRIDIMSNVIYNAKGSTDESYLR